MAITSRRLHLAVAIWPGDEVDTGGEEGTDEELAVHMVVGLDVGSVAGSVAVVEAMVADTTIKNQMNEMAWNALLGV